MKDIDTHILVDVEKWKAIEQSTVDQYTKLKHFAGLFHTSPSIDLSEANIKKVLIKHAYIIDEELSLEMAEEAIDDLLNLKP